ncbi:hypothetical protein CRG98_031238, partial [Punica granatum]
KIEREGGSGRPIGDPDPSTEVADTHRGRGDIDGGVGVTGWRPQPRIDRGLRVKGPQLIQGWGRRLTPPSRSPIPTEDAGNLRGGGRRLVAPIPNRPGTSNSDSSIDSWLGQPIGDPDPSTEIARVLHGYQNPRRRGRSRRLAAPTPNRPGTSDLKSLVNSVLGPLIGYPDPSTEVAGFICGYR